MNDLMIDAAGVRKRFRGQEAVRGVDLAVERGAIVALLGPNGAGKTTMIRILTTLVAPDSGVISINGFDLARDAQAVRRCIGSTGQEGAVDAFLTGEENLMLMARLAHLRPTAARLRTAELIDEFDLGEFVGRKVANCSGGMRRRLDLAMSLVARPPLVFLDEPTTGLDPRSRMGLWDVVRSLSNDGVTVLLTTQYLEEADRLADRVVVIDGGRIVAEGSPTELKQRVGRERVLLGFADEADFDAAQRLIASASADLATLVLSIETSKASETIKHALDVLADASTPIEIASIEVARPSLDDVFFVLTSSAIVTNEVAA